MFDSSSVTKVESVVLIAIIMVAVVGGGAAYFMLSGESSSDTIRIGVCADIDSVGGKAVWQGAILAAEHVNAEGGILGRNVTIVAEDDDSNIGMDPDKASKAMNKLIAGDKADFVLTSGIANMIGIYQEIVADHETIMFHYGAYKDEITQKVLDDYDRYKYYFRLNVNETTSILLRKNVFETMQEYTGLNKAAIWKSGLGSRSDTIDADTATLTELGMDVVHTAVIPYDTIDFTGYFVQAESRGAEIIIPYISAASSGVQFVKEYATRESPTVIWNLPYMATPDSWETTGGACNFITSGIKAVVAGYPLTSHVIPLREAYLERWGEPLWAPFIAFAYDVVRFILPDAIKRAGTIETDAVIEALEQTELEETSLHRNLVFTSSHDRLITVIEDHMGNTHFQWQNGEQAVVYPRELMVDAGATYIFPDWPGPWD